MDNTYISIDDATKVAIFMCRTDTFARDEDIKKRFYESRALDVQPIIRAHWIYKQEEWGQYASCSNCNHDTLEFTKYCPDCGALMENYENECASCKLP